MTKLTFKQQVAEVQRLRSEPHKLTFQQIADKIRISETTARRRYALAVSGKEIVEPTQVVGELEDFPEVAPLDLKVTKPLLPVDKGKIERFDPLVRVGDAMVVCDLHIPLHDPILINTMISCARKNKIKKLIIGGDYYNMETFSSYLPYQPEAALDIERHDGAYIMKTLLLTFDEIDFIWGNHDFRLTKKLGFKKSFEECMRWMLSDLSEREMARIRFSDLDYMYYHPAGEDGPKYRICHPQNFSGTPLTVARKLAQKYQCSVITAHSHQLAIGVSPDGEHICIEGGGFFDKNRTEYIQRTTNHHEWCPGFTLFKNGVPTLISPVFGNDVEYR